MGLEDHLGKRLEEWEDAGLRRSIPWREGEEPGVLKVVDFSSNDYLGLSEDRRIIQAMADNLNKAGSGVGASRLVNGSPVIFRDLEEALADWKQKQRSLFFNSGYQMNISVLPALLESGDKVFFDRLCHASLIDGIRLAGCYAKSFRHNDFSDLEEKLQKAQAGGEASEATRIYVVTEGIFSMDGDFAPLKEIADLKSRYRFSLIVDEAHSSGLFGSCGQGISHLMGVNDAVDVLLGTCGKAMGVSGGFVCGSEKLTEWLIQKCRGFIYSTAPPACIAAGVLKSLEIISGGDGDGLRASLQKRIADMVTGLGISPENKPPLSPIIPVLTGSNQQTMDIGNHLKNEGFLTGAIRYPTVPQNKARLRITVKATSTSESIIQFTQALKKIQSEHNSECPD